MVDINKAISYIQNMDLSTFNDKKEAEEAVDLITSILQQQLNNEWIPVSSGLLPADCKKLLISIGTEVYRGTRYEGWWYVYYPYGQRLESHVDAWKQLPESYKEGLKDEGQI